MADEPADNSSPNSGENGSGRDGGRRALLLAAAGVGIGALMLADMFWTNIGFVGAATLFFAVPVVELVALILGLTAGRGTVMGRVAAVVAAVCLCGWGYVLYRLLTMPLIRLF